jgi:phosphoribosylformimino-5-aminoimidazole carboxamide ribotide isomerase
VKLWPAIDLSEGRVVRLLQGDPGRLRSYDVTPEDAARRYAGEGADGIHLVDLDAALGKGSNRDVVRRVLASVKVPVEVGGGIRSRAAIDEALHEGAARVVLGTLPFTEPELFKELVESRAPNVVVALDCLDGMPRIQGWMEDSGTLDVAAVAEVFGALGVRSLLVTDIARDGTLTGPNESLLASVRRAFAGEILASGGVRNAADLPIIERALAGGAASVVLGRALLEGFVSVRELKAGGKSGGADSFELALDEGPS